LAFYFHILTTVLLVTGQGSLTTQYMYIDINMFIQSLLIVNASNLV